MEIIDTLNHFYGLINIVLVIITIIVGYFSWKRETIGKEKFKFLYEILESVYEIEDIFYRFRLTVIPDISGKTINELSKTNPFYEYFKILNKLKLYSKKAKFLKLENLAKSLDKFYDLYLQINANLNQLLNKKMRTKEGEFNESLVKLYDYLIFESQEDELSSVIKNNILEIEKLIQEELS